MHLILLALLHDGHCLGMHGYTILPQQKMQTMMCTILCYTQNTLTTVAS